MQQQDLGQRFSFSKIHLSPSPYRYGCCPLSGFVVVDLVFNVSIDCGGYVLGHCFVAFPYGAVDWSVVFDCDFSRSYYLNKVDWV